MECSRPSGGQAVIGRFVEMTSGGGVGGFGPARSPELTAVVAGYGWGGCLSVMNAVVVDGAVSHGSASVFVAR